MEIAKVQVSGCQCRPIFTSKIPKGIVGATVSIEYTDPMWDGLVKTAVFFGSQTKDVLNVGNVVTVPAEVVSQVSTCLFMGIYGVDAENNLVIPTLWANLGMIESAADPSGDASTYPSLPMWAQLQAMIGVLSELNTEAKDNLVAAVNEAARGSCSASDVHMTISSGYIQYSTDSGKTWANLIALSDLVGADGKPGDNGLTPHIGDNGNWYTGETDTGVHAQGEPGVQGQAGPAGPQGPAGAAGATTADVISALSKETWTFTLADGTSVDKVVPLI